jgi:PAS domain S-box-containing protein
MLSGVVVVFRDITERCRMEQELKEEKHLLHTLLDYVPSHIYFKDLQSRFLRLSQSLMSHFRLSEPSQAIGKSDFDFLPESHANKAYADEQEIIRTRVPLIGEVERVTFPDGEVRWVSTSKMPLLDPSGQVIGTFGISTDITRQKMAEEALQKTHEEIEQLVSSIPSILIGIDSQTRITQWNQTAAETFGLAAAEVHGLPLAQLPIHWNVSSLMERISRAIESPRPMSLDDIRFKRQDGRDGFLGFTLRSFERTKGGQSGCLLIGADITERRALEAQLRQAQKLESIGQLAAGIAHEINTPTQFVGDNIRFLQDVFQDLRQVGETFLRLLQAAQEGKISPVILAEVDAVVQRADIKYLLEEIPRAIQQSLDGIARVTKIVRSMKDFAHPDLAEKIMADLNKAIESTITVARNEWKYVAEMVLDLDPSLPLVPCVVGDFNQVILNLVINAAHAIGEKVRDAGGKGTITIQTRKVDNWAEVRVNDTGTGIEERHRSRIFDPFFTTKEVGKGTGQGLTISHAIIVEKHQGTISFETQLGKGTTFIIRLPLPGMNADPEGLTSVDQAGHHATHLVC